MAQKTYVALVLQNYKRCYFLVMFHLLHVLQHMDNQRPIYLENTFYLSSQKLQMITALKYIVLLLCCLVSPRTIRFEVGPKLAYLQPMRIYYLNCRWRIVYPKVLVYHCVCYFPASVAFMIWSIKQHRLAQCLSVSTCTFLNTMHHMYYAICSLSCETCIIYYGNCHSTKES